MRITINPVKSFRWTHTTEHLDVSLSHRQPTSSEGRFGGGWQWKVGVQVGRRTVLLSLVVFELRVVWR